MSALALLDLLGFLAGVTCSVTVLSDSKAALTSGDAIVLFFLPLLFGLSSPVSDLFPKFSVSDSVSVTFLFLSSRVSYLGSSSVSGMVGVSVAVLLRAPDILLLLGGKTGVKTGVAPDSLLDLLTGVAGVWLSLTSSVTAATASITSESGASVITNLTTNTLRVDLTEVSPDFS